MKKHMFGLMGALGVMAMFGAAASADRLADPAEVLAPNPAVVRVYVGETDRLSGMTDYYVVVESEAPVAAFEPLPAVILREIGQVGETDRMSGTFDLDAESQQHGVAAGFENQPGAVLGRLQRVGETDRLSGMTDYYEVPESFTPSGGFEPLPLAILWEIERVNREH